jgi:hypothetical protein
MVSSQLSFSAEGTFCGAWNYPEPKHHVEAELRGSPGNGEVGVCLARLVEPPRVVANDRETHAGARRILPLAVVEGGVEDGKGTIAQLALARAVENEEVSILIVFFHKTCGEVAKTKMSVNRLAHEA